MSAASTQVPLAPPPPLEPSPPAQAAPTMVTGSFVSAARGGISTNWAIARPPGQTKALRPVIALHGKGSDASTVMAGGVEHGLAQAVSAGLPPFAVVAVDGGGGYWHKRASGEDSGAMVLNELIPMLDSQVWTLHGWRSWAGRWAATARCCSAAGWARPHRGDLRGEPGAVAVVRSGSTGRVRRGRRFRGELGVRAWPRWAPSRSGWTAATATRSTRRPSSSSLSCPIRPRAASRRAGTTRAFWSSQLPAELNWMAPLLTA